MPTASSDFLMAQNAPVGDLVSNPERGQSGNECFHLFF
jgi:hypothetical protein